MASWHLYLLMYHSVSSQTVSSTAACSGTDMCDGFMHWLCCDRQCTAEEQMQCCNVWVCRHEQAIANLQSQLDVHHLTAQDIHSQLILKDRHLAEAR